MTRNALIDRCKAVLAEAYEEATEMIVAYLELHPAEQLRPLCREIDPDNWNALRNRVQRAQGNRKSIRGADSSGARALRRAKQGLREATPEELAEVMADLPTETVQKIADATYRTQVDRLPPSTAENDLSTTDYEAARESMADIRDTSSIEMDELFTALSRVRVKTVEKLVANATVKQRREWGERLPDEIALLQLALDLCRTHKLEAVR